MKKIISVSLIITLLLSFTACGGKNNVTKSDYIDITAGILSDMVDISADKTMALHLADEHNELLTGNGNRIIYSNLSTLLLALRSGKIALFGTNSSTAEYLTANNEDLVSFNPPGVEMQTEFSMFTSETNTEVHNILDEGIKELKADGTLDKLIEDYLTSDNESDPVPVSMPFISGAKTIKVAVTGDMPPLDYVSADGVPAGFNVALLSEISKRTGVNIELVTLEAGARMVALTSAKVDAVFWACATVCKEHPDVKIHENLVNTLKTEPYVKLDTTMVKLSNSIG